MFTAARLVHWDLYEGKCRVFQHHEVVSGSVVSCVTDCDGDLVKDDGGGFNKRFFDFKHILKGPDMKILVLGKDMRPDPAVHPGLYHGSDHDTSWFGTTIYSGSNYDFRSKVTMQ